MQCRGFLNSIVHSHWLVILCSQAFGVVVDTKACFNDAEFGAAVVACKGDFLPIVVILLGAPSANRVCYSLGYEVVVLAEVLLIAAKKAEVITSHYDSQAT